ncbi:MAG TPA: hypothetical protein DCR40_16745 [Prolixibacteraceae bacterium]|nr:hypothetical protein [Prolixibacteraceae bacterium]
MDKKIILEGLTLEDFQSILRETVREEITANDSKKVAPMSKTEAGRQLGITNKTLSKILKEMNISEVFPSDINRILFKYPKYIRKAITANQPWANIEEIKSQKHFL